jgi:phosphoribosylformylglycinamidine synthase
LNIQETYSSLGLSDFEYDRILDLWAGRRTSWSSLLSVMWSEHCGYKNSRPLLRRFPSEGRGCCRGRGRIAGSWRWAKVGRSSSRWRATITLAVEPTRAPPPEWAASSGTCSRWGLGRSRLLNSLRFGSLDDERNRYLFREVVRGVGGYGNAIGVPTVAARSSSPGVLRQPAGERDVRRAGSLRGPHAGAGGGGREPRCPRRARPAGTASTALPSPPTS